MNDVIGGCLAGLLGFGVALCVTNCVRFREYQYAALDDNWPTEKVAWLAKQKRRYYVLSFAMVVVIATVLLHTNTRHLPLWDKGVIALGTMAGAFSLPLNYWWVLRWRCNGRAVPPDVATKPGVDLP